MDLKEIKRLISLMNENGLIEIEIAEEGRRCVLKKGHPAGAYPVHIAPFSAGAAAPSAHVSGMPGATKPAPAAQPEPEDTVTFNSPMVGTFYKSAEPGSEAFVKAGDRVNPETVLCLIEAMKVFNEIKAEMSGTIIDVLVDNQEAVEFNQPLFLIKP